MDMYVVGVYKKGKNIAGFKILAINSDNSVDTRDVSYADVLNVVGSGKGTIKNLKIDNGELKGSNGSLDRYGVIGKSQALVVLKELQDNNGKTLGYFCSDSLGQTRNLTEQQVVLFAEKFGIANGKIVTNESGNKHVSSIDGAYDFKRPIQQRQEKTNETNTDTLSSDVIAAINKIKARPEYKGSTAENIVNSIEKNNRCTEKQKLALNDIYSSWLRSGQLPKEVSDLVEEVKGYSKYKGSFAEKIVKFVEANRRCSEKQLASLKKERNRLKEIDDKNSEKPKQSEQKTETNTNNTNTATQNNSKAVKSSSTPVSSTPVSSTPVSSTPVSSTPVSSTPVNAALAKKAARITRDNELESKKRDSESVKERIELARKSMDAKQKRALTQNIASIGLFDYSFTKDGRAYVEGFSADVTVPDDLVIPETVEYKGKTYKVTGISIGAFQTEQIVTVTTSKYINDIGQKAFQYCSKLESVDLSKSMHTLIPARLFAWCERLSDVKVGNHVQKVHEYAFSGCKSIENMQLPEECTTISRCGFEWCTGLKSFNCHVKTYDFGAFFNCNSLTDFDFSSALSIAPQAFRRTGFNQLDLPGNIRVIGEKGFADCYRLQKVTLEDGIEELGAFCFAKSEFESASLGNVGYGDKVKLDEVYAPKSIILIGADAFRNVGEVVGWTGSVAESKCISFNTPFRRLDATNTENSTSTRVKAEMFNINPIKTLKNKIDSPVEGKSNPEFVMKTDKLVDIEFGDNQLAFLNMQKSDENREPHILFKAVVNYLQDMADLLQSPFSNGVLRLQNTFYVLNTPLYDDGCNKISKITYQIMDTLESGSFIVVFMNNHLRFVCDCNLYTDIIMTKETFTDDNLPMVDFLHAGDVIGEQSTISGHDGILQEELEKYNVGQRFYNMILRNSFRVFITKKDSMIYVPCTEIFMSLHDKRADNIEGEEKIDVECQSVLEIGTYDQFIAELKKVKKNIGGSEKFFDELCKLSQSDVNRRVSDINTIEDEKEAQLFLVSKKFNQIVDSAGIAPNPNLLTYELFNELSRSYWMISKDEDWLQQTGRKSLNRTAEYHIGKYKLTEFKSNQIVKFSNPYMNGCKGAYVFTLTSGNNVLGVYASRFSMHYITEKLYDLTNIKKDVNIPDAIFTDADKIDKLSPNLFYDFYDVLYSKGGWSFKDFKRSYSNQGVAFNISMYKPTGVFYLTMTRTTPTYVDGNKTVKGVKTMPILPIGNMDRALMVATTTNTNAKDTNLYDELMELAAYNDKEDRLMRVLDAELNRSLDLVHDKYTAARKLIIAGVKDVSQYKKLIDDRAVYMLGTVHKGKLQREFGYRDDEDADEFEIDDIDISEDSIIDDDEIVLDDSDDEILLDDVDGEDGDPDESVAISFEEFFETAKQMGVTDEARARAMYVSFMSNK